jgi:hypothetical protein
MVCELKGDRYRLTQVTDKCQVKMILLARPRRMPLLKSVIRLGVKYGPIFLGHPPVDRVNSKETGKGKGRAVEVSFVSEKAPRVDVNLEFADPVMIWRKRYALASDGPASDRQLCPCCGERSCGCASSSSSGAGSISH